MKKKLSEVIKTVYRTLSTLLASLFIIIATTAVIFYANGYRIGRDGVVERTGVLTVKSNPSRSDVKLNGYRDGRTTKTFSSLSNDTDYTVEVSRDGYHLWSKTTQIKSERSTPLFAYLFKTDPEREVEVAIDETLVEIYKTIDSSKIFFITATSDEATQPTVETVSNPDEIIPDQGVKTYRIWSLNTSQRFWDTSDNPQLIVEHDIAALSEMELLISPDDDLALWKIKTVTSTQEEKEDGEIVENLETDFITYLIETNSPTESESLEQIDLDPFYEEYTINWSEDSRFLLLDSDSEIIGMNISNKSKTLLLKKSADNDTENVWTTDLDGTFYHVEYSTDDQDNSFARIVRQDLTGSSPEPVVDQIYSYETAEFIGDDLSKLQTPFTNSVDNPRFAGEINRIGIHNDGDSMVISTQFALYWYSIETEKFILVTNAPASYLSTNENSTKFLFEQSDKIGVFTFDKEDEDHTEQIGTKFLLDNKDSIANVMWHANSEYIFYNDGINIRVLDDEGDNNTPLLQIADPFFFSPTTNSEEIVVLEGDVIPEIVRYTIH